MWNVGRDDHDVTGFHDVLSSLRVHLSETLGNPRDLFVDVVSKRHNGTFLRSPLHKRDVGSLEILPIEKLIDLFHRLRVEVEELGFAREMQTDIRQNTAPRSVFDLQNELGCDGRCSIGAALTFLGSGFKAHSRNCEEEIKVSFLILRVRSPALGGVEGWLIRRLERLSPWTYLSRPARTRGGGGSWPRQP